MKQVTRYVTNQAVTEKWDYEQWTYAQWGVGEQWSYVHRGMYPSVAAGVEGGSGREYLQWVRN